MKQPLQKNKRGLTSCDFRGSYDSVLCLITMLLWDSKYVKNISALKQIPSSLVVVVLGVVINLVYAVLSILS